MGGKDITSIMSRNSRKLHRWCNHRVIWKNSHEWVAFVLPKSETKMADKPKSEDLPRLPADFSRFKLKNYGQDMEKIFMKSVTAKKV